MRKKRTEWEQLLGWLAITWMALAACYFLARGLHWIGGT